MRFLLARKHLLKALRVILALLLFGQFTLLAQACTAPVAGAVMMEPGAQASMPCCKQMSANACLAQLTQFDKAPTASHAVMLADATLVPVGTIARIEPEVPAFRIRSTTVLDLHEPPSSIRFCSFQT